MEIPPPNQQDFFNKAFDLATQLLGRVTVMPLVQAMAAPGLDGKAKVFVCTDGHDEEAILGANEVIAELSERIETDD